MHKYTHTHIHTYTHIHIYIFIYLYSHLSYFHMYIIYIYIYLWYDMLCTPCLARRRSCFLNCWRICRTAGLLATFVVWWQEHVKMHCFLLIWVITRFSFPLRDINYIDIYWYKSFLPLWNCGSFKMGLFCPNMPVYVHFTVSSLINLKE